MYNVAFFTYKVSFAAPKSLWCLCIKRERKSTGERRSTAATLKDEVASSFHRGLPDCGKSFCFSVPAFYVENFYVCGVISMK